MILVYFCVQKGVKLSGKIAVYTSSLPFILLIILILRGIFLPGALNGLYYLFKPDFTRIFEPGISRAAVA